MQSQYLAIHPEDHFLDILRLRSHLRNNPLVGLSLTKVLLPVESMRAFLYMFSGRLYALQSIFIEADLQFTAAPLLRAPVYAACSRFSNVRKLHLSNIVFWSFGNFARLICALRSLVKLTLKRVSWDGDEGRSLADEPFATCLRLKVIKIDSADVSQYRNLLAAPNLLHTVSHLHLKYKKRRQAMLIVRLENSRPQPTSSSLSALARTAKIQISMARNQAWFRSCFDLLDSFFCSSSTVCLNRVNVDMEEGNVSEDIKRMFFAKPLVFSALRARGMEIEVHQIPAGCTAM
ncbi:hypothetical protein OBBRIDRAFT_302728 [Obba rivulosa]|uniref:FBD domain-containing protein n=1 Tax=Obba rivulosa TaxID=1052685 RepID=A0A8E2DPN7_9APHY|nr:hypothetical protein OBBRIDRAFT_302728 [Obba rivulosa]